MELTRNEAFKLTISEFTHHCSTSEPEAGVATLLMEWFTMCTVVVVMVTVNLLT